MSPSSTDHSLSTRKMPVSVSETDASCKWPVLCLLSGSAVWLLVATVALLVASMSFHSPTMFADCAAFSYGRMAAVANNTLLYGFCVPAAWAVALWLLARLGRTTLAYAATVFIGGKVWNLGVLAGVVGILTGDGSGFENIEFPVYAACLLLVGSVLVGISGVTTLRERAEPAMHPSQWFAGLSLFWFPWIYFTATLLLQVWPVRGVAQVAVQDWFQAQFQLVMLGLAGIGVVFYFVPVLRQQPLHSRHLGLFALLTLILFGGWIDVSPQVPLPVWMGVLGGVMSVGLVIPILAVVINVWKTPKAAGVSSAAEGGFFSIGVLALVVWAVLNALRTISTVRNLTAFTLIHPALFHLLINGFVVIVLLGAAYHMLPRVAGIALPFPGFVRAHLWLATLGMLLIVLPFLAGGWQQGLKLTTDVAFTEVAKSTLMPIRVASLGELFLILGSLLLIGNVLVLLWRMVWTTLKAFNNHPVSLPKTAEVKA